MKNMIFGLIMILLSSCSLEENIKKEEEKDYTDVVHPVDMADYEFEQRLNSFYESEPIKNEELYGLYKGEFPDGEKNPQKLRIHWKDARELALAELELQRPLHSGWEEGDISERPVLRLDRDGGDFYRYYEYRVVKGLKFLGAIRIPAYRRTENFATAEVHRYSDDQKTYTIHPNGWGGHVSEHSYFESSEFKNKIGQQLSVLQNKHILFNIISRLMSISSDNNNFPTIPRQTAEDLIFSYFMSQRGNRDWEPRKPISKDQFKYSSRFIAKSNSVDMSKILSQGIKTMSIFEGAANTISTLGSKLQENFKDQFENFFFTSLKFILIDMVSDNSNSKLREYLKEYYWIKIESMLSQNKNVLQDKWNLGEPMDTYNISPFIYFPNKQLINNLSVNHTYSEFNYKKYKYLNKQTFESYLEHSLGFKSIEDDQYYIFQGKSLGNDIKNVVRENIYFEELLAVKVEQTPKGSRAYSNFSTDNKEVGLEDLANNIVVYSDFVNSVDELGNRTKVTNVQLGEFASFF